MTDVAPESQTTEGNARPYSVSELAFALKRTLEDAYGFVRLRGELSKVTHHSNGHVYLTIKDERAAIDGVVWKGQVRGLSIRPEHGLEVIVTGKITAYPAGSRYQIVIETMEAAGVGALLAQLERLKAKLAGEGLFEPARKRPLPVMPAVIGVITSPTGAVIRDILHRIRDRWPCRVIVWPVVVQGDAAAAQVCAAIDGFNALDGSGPIARPDVLIVARGGGSVEDLWPFNDEALARTAAASAIPLISAVGHETDTTLIDFVSDRRAPTPTAAAEMATPVLAELKAAVADFSARMHRRAARVVEDRRSRVEAADRSLKRVPDLLRLAEQRFDIVSGRLTAGLARNAAVHERELVRVASRLSPLLLQRPQAVQKQRLDGVAARLQPAVERRLERVSERLAALGKLYASVDPERPLQRGFARVSRLDGSIVHAGASLLSGEELSIKFGDKVTRQAVVDGDPAPAAAPKPARAKPKPTPAAQGDLF
ncbi:exodeoxyribonuclease VII large subunit [Phenylobacterium hankyongense]|uniref:Exodeoxyribonuclease 7 large subunit n=1 Tax=Phenylobacterium hankyongense TaxID=1813876 RepID=A0A328AZ71_9CAUL|nr:exodeoxyribonuclease VII large subunit [Phenylobacterium hankyongense]RAK58894.1 exodeoxyribonuclease VII large subunit [Phenylobacterium hankyongense]